MAEELEKDEQQQPVPPLPPKGTMLQELPLYLTQIANYRNALAFSGQKNPSAIWTSMVRDDSNAVIYYRELEEKDEDVGDALDSLKYSVLTRQRSVEPGDDSQQALDAATFVEKSLQALPNFENALDNLLDMCGYGFSVQELIFDVSMGQAALTDINDCPQELFLFGERFRPQIGPLQILESPWMVTGAPAPEQKFVVGTYRGRGRNRMGRPLLRSIFWPSWFKRNVLGFWLRRSEKAQGMAVVRYPDGANEMEKQQAAQISLAFIERSAISVPDNLKYDMEMLKASLSITADLYEHLYQLMQYSIARRILGQTLTTFGGEGGKGTQALGSVHQDTLDARSVAIAKTLMATVNRQIVRNIVLWNFGPDCPLPKWTIDVEEKEDLTKALAIDQGAQRMGAKLPVKYVLKKYQIPAAENNEPVLIPNATAAEPAINERLTSQFGDSAHDRLAQWWSDVVEGEGRTPTFAEVSAAARNAYGKGSRQTEAQRDAEVQRELKEFDKVLNQLNDAALKDYAVRVQEITDTTRAVE